MNRETKAVIYVRVGKVENQIVVEGNSYGDMIVKGADLIKALARRCRDFEILAII